MAKYCMFCGNPLPEVAQFCPACGRKQPQEAQQPQEVQQPEENEKLQEEVVEREPELMQDEDEESDEMDLLSQFGYAGKAQPKKPASPNITARQGEKKPAKQYPRKPDRLSVANEDKSDAEFYDRVKNIFPEVEPEGDKFEDGSEYVPEPKRVEQPTSSNTLSRPQSRRQPASRTDNRLNRETRAPSRVQQEEPAPQKEAPRQERVVETRQPDTARISLDTEKQEEQPAPRSRREEIMAKRSAEAKQISNRLERPASRQRPSRPARETSESQKSTVPFKPTNTRRNENAMPTASSEDEAKYDLPDDFSIANDDDDDDSGMADFASMLARSEAARKEEEERQRMESDRRRRGDNVAAISSQKKSRLEFRKRVVEDTSDEDETFSTSLNESGNSMISNAKLYADEEATNKKRKKKRGDTDDDDDQAERPQRRQRTSEGRKQTNVDTAHRKRSSRSDDIDKNIYDIEHDMSNMDPMELEYDGYYENVLPLDHDNIQKKGINWKIVGAVAVVIAMLVAAGAIIALII